MAASTRANLWVPLTTAAPGERLANDLVFCTVRSWVTGRRMVSVPFSDHCEPLAGTEEERAALIAGVQEEREANRAKYFEIRPLTALDGTLAGAEISSRFCLHQLDLPPGLDQLFRGLHRDCIQRKVRRAERE